MFEEQLGATYLDAAYRVPAAPPPGNAAHRAGPGSPGQCQQADTYLVGQVTDRRRIATGQADTTN
jgi:hypothetical protein